MRVLICPDKFAGTISAGRAAAAIAAGWLEAAPDDLVTTRPLADGGPGFLEVIEASVGGDRLAVHTCDALGTPIAGWVLLAGERHPETGPPRAFVESAQACGLHLVPPARRDPKVTTSYGVGLLVAAAVEAGVAEIVVGLGGTASNDGGAGMLAALGAAPLDAAGYALPHGGVALAHCVGLGGVPRLRDVTLVAATDVDNPLTGPRGASAVFGPQKGATGADVALLDAALARWAAVLERALPTCPTGLAARSGAGAAGGLAGAILACGGRRESGFGLVRALTGLDEALARAELVITGEGCFDEQSLAGKLVGGVARAARARGVPCVVLAGQVRIGRARARRSGVSEAYSLAEYAGSVSRAQAQPEAGLRTLAQRLASQLRAGVRTMEQRPGVPGPEQPDDQTG